MLQYVAVCCSVLHCVALCCSVRACNLGAVLFSRVPKIRSLAHSVL